jgi:branched-chain amino acid aminotransferase
MVHRFILHNDDIREASDRVLSPGQVGLLSGWGVFSTIRVIDGVLFAFERHWARMTRDAALFRVTLPRDSENVKAHLLQLAQANEAPNCTMRVVVVRNGGGVWEGPSVGRPSDLIALTADLHDWGAGVNLKYVPQSRHAGCTLAGTKILAWAQNLTWLEEAQKQGFDEVILLNERGEVAECTSANIFLANGNKVSTPPLSSGCLPGITRELLLTEVQLADFPVHEKTLKPADLEKADEVFITSTTRNLLPVMRIGKHAIPNSGQARESLQQAFAEYVAEYIGEQRESVIFNT